ncbi:hypothetical protein NDU88_006170 [Pleurodeles waltl]|uniref:Uncharacterized protein n=1 Tax=Pleurodeles waltl TaxID=8319 RepID=A0AAV7LNA4_PLEWA|nr:hypothetical protein NDU88_006170 [Pleurodeles waltl]
MYLEKSDKTCRLQTPRVRRTRRPVSKIPKKDYTRPSGCEGRCECVCSSVRACDPGGGGSPAARCDGRTPHGADGRSALWTCLSADIPATVPPLRAPTGCLYQGCQPSHDSAAPDAALLPTRTAQARGLHQRLPARIPRKGLGAKARDQAYGGALPSPPAQEKA